MEIAQCEAVGAHYRVVTVRGEGLRDRSWRPGDIFQILFAGWQARAYTPIVWSCDGVVSFLAYLHGDGVASKWLSSARSGERCHVYGPRSALDLVTAPRPLVLFGDESSLGTAGAALCTADETRGLECIFEVDDPAAARDALHAIGFHGEATFLERGGGHEHLDVVRERFAGRVSVHGIFTGRAASLKYLNAALRRDGVSTKRIKNTPYWAAGKRGLE